MIPAAFEPRGDANWWIRLRCGACECSRELVVTEAEAQRYDADLDTGVAEIRDALRRLERRLMAEEADALAAALHHDLIDAGDFAP